MAGPSSREKRRTRIEYERLVDLGAFRPGDRLELVGGALLVREPQGGPHFTAVGLVEDAPRVAFGPGWTVRAPPSRPVLIVEVADSTLRFDRREKGSLDARAGVADYWIVNLVDQVLEVYREPVAGPHEPYGHRYTAAIALRGGEHVIPLSAPHASVPVADLLP